MTVNITNVGLSGGNANPGSAGSIRGEFGLASQTSAVSLSQYYRGGARVPIGTANGGYGLIATSGAISVGTFRNTSASVTINLTISSNTTNYNIFTAAGSPGTAANVTVTINSGVTVYSNTVSAALDTGTGWVAGSTISIINNGSIIGVGGFGAYYSSAGVVGNATYGANGGNGGDAFRAQYATTVTNNGTIAGGGGGGGSGSNIDGTVGGGNPSNWGGQGKGGITAGFLGGSGSFGGTSISAAGFIPVEGSSNQQTATGGTYGNTNGTDGGVAGTQTPQTPRGFIGTGTSGDPSIGQASAGGGGAGYGAFGGIGAAVYNQAYGFHSTAGGYPGSYVIGNSNVTWNVVGTRVGLVDGLSVHLSTGANIIAVRANATTATATLTFNSNGTISGTAVGLVSPTYAENWYKTTTAGIGSSYWIRVTPISSTGLTNPSTGTTGSWISLSTSPAWSNTISTVTTKQSKLTIEIASDAAGSNIVATGLYYLRCYRSA